MTDHCYWNIDFRLANEPLKKKMLLQDYLDLPCRHADSPWSLGGSLLSHGGSIQPRKLIPKYRNHGRSHL
jgi:hypothetical protein